jgi:hypothetical protein
MEEKNLKLLRHFDDKYKGVVFNTILFYIRKGEKYADEIINLIQKKLEIQRRWGLEGTNLQWDRYFKIIDNETQLGDFYEIMEYAFEWEKKSPEEKQKIKIERDEYYKNLNIKNSMKGKEPTEKQIAFLKSKGQKIPENRYECSILIDKLIKHE